MAWNMKGMKIDGLEEFVPIKVEPEKRCNNTPKKPYDIPENSCAYCVHGQPNSTNKKCLGCNNRSEFRRYK